jgi:hypothetical protein
MARVISAVAAALAHSAAGGAEAAAVSATNAFRNAFHNARDDASNASGIHSTASSKASEVPRAFLIEGMIRSDQTGVDLILEPVGSEGQLRVPDCVYFAMGPQTCTSAPHTTRASGRRLLVLHSGSSYSSPTKPSYPKAGECAHIVDADGQNLNGTVDLQRGAYARLYRAAGMFAAIMALRTRSSDWLCADGSALGRIQYVEQSVPKPVNHLAVRIGFFLHSDWHLEKDIQCRACDEHRNHVVLKASATMSRYAIGHCAGTLDENLLREADVKMSNSALHFSFHCAGPVNCRRSHSANRAALCFYSHEASQRGVYLGQVSFSSGSTEMFGFLLFVLYMAMIAPLLCLWCIVAYAGKLRVCRQRSRLGFLTRELDELRSADPAEAGGASV